MIRLLSGMLCAGAVFLGYPMAASAQMIEIRPPSVRLGPAREEPAPRAAPRDKMREEMAEFRERCEEGSKRACVRLGIMIGENRERRAQWRRESPELFFWERETR